jgi:O-antigen ligase
MNWRVGIKVMLPLMIVAFCLFEYVLHRQSGIFREFVAILLSLQWMLLVCIAIWCAGFLFLTFSLNDLPLIGLLLITIVAYFIGYATPTPATDAITLLGSVTLGKSTFVVLQRDKDRNNFEIRSQVDGRNTSEARIQNSEFRVFLLGFVILLAFSSWWHLDISGNFYHGPRWMGLWDNPNIYGMLMSAGLTLAIGLLAASPKSKIQTPNSTKSVGENKARDSWNLSLRIVLSFAAGMMVVGLLFSYSRGSWFGTTIGLLYLAKAFGKFKWRYIFPAVVIIAAVVCFFWNATPETSPWYVKRLDFGRPSAQHRVAAWKAGFEIMRDHPFGVGWNKAVETYRNNYSPPENGAAAITTNDYLMLGSRLGIPGLLCFVTYVALRLRSPKPKVQSPKSGNGDALDVGRWTLDPPQVACRAAALSLLVAFWFDGGLFELPTATVFWILLELGKVSPPSRKVVVQPV